MARAKFHDGISGLNELTAALERLPHEMQEKIAKRAVVAGGKVIQDAMQERCPIQEVKAPGSDSLGPGQLRSDIKVRSAGQVLEADDAGSDNAKLASIRDGVYSALIGPKQYAYVAGWVEYGHANIKGGYSRLIAAGKKNAGKRRGEGHEIGEPTPPHPFLRPAFEQSVEDAKAAMLNAMRAGLKNAVRAAKGK